RPMESYQVKVVKNDVYLVEQAISAQGNPVQKITVFNSGALRNNEPRVRAHLLVDGATGREICSAYTDSVRIDPGSHAVVPRSVHIIWKEQHIEMRMKLDEVTVNGPLDANDVAVLFTRPTMDNVPSIDLARISESGFGVQKAGAYR